MKKYFKVSVLSLLLSVPALAQNVDNQPVAATNSMPADIEKLLIKSPYLDFQVNVNRAIAIADIKSEWELTPEQNACLLSLESNPSYLEVLEPYMKSILSDAELKEADEFFASDAGRKLADAMLMQIGAENVAPPIEPTASEKMEIAKALTKPFMVKVKSKTDAMTEQEAIDFAMPIYEKELARCNIS